MERDLKSVSAQQRMLIQHYRDEYPPSLILRELLELVRERSEQLSPDWQAVWKDLKQTAARDYPPSVFQEIDKAITSIRIIDEAAWNVRIAPGIHVTFLLGAGASAPSKIPTVNDLLPELWRRARRIGRDDLDQLAQWCSERKITNIEDLLTSAYIANYSVRSDSVTNLLEYFLAPNRRGEIDEDVYFRRRHRGAIPRDISSVSFLQDTLQTLFSLLTSTMISARPNAAHRAIVHFYQEHPETSIITTNYDGCMDEAFLAAHIPLKSTVGGNDEASTSEGVELVKMHGSINWSYCDSCQDVREFDLTTMKEIYEQDKLSYPVMGICRNCEGLRRPMLVPPMSFKFLMFPTLIDVWNSARIAIEKAKYLVVVGYSFSEADTYITKIISHSMATHPDQVMMVVTTDPSLVAVLRDRFSARVDHFEKDRIICIDESCDVVVPKLVKSMVDSGTGSRPSKTKEKSSVHTAQGS